MGACKDEVVPPPPGGGGGGSGGTGATTGTGGGGGSVGSGGNVGGIGGVGIGGDARINETALDIIGMTVPNLRWQAADCGTVCEGRAHDEFIDCANQRVQTRAAGLSSGCTSCYGDLAWCVGTACNNRCADPVAKICATACTTDSVECPGYSTCLTELNRCAGRDSLDCLDDT